MAELVLKMSKDDLARAVKYGENNPEVYPLRVDPYWMLHAEGQGDGSVHVWTDPSDVKFAIVGGRLGRSYFQYGSTSGLVVIPHSEVEWLLDSPDAEIRVYLEY